MHIFRCIFLSNYWRQDSDIWSQASYRYAILWEAFLDPSDSYFLFADLVGFYIHWTYMHIFRDIFLSNYWWQRSDIWSQALFNVYKNQLSRQTGNRNLMGPKTLPTIWYTYMTLVTKYQISERNATKNILDGRKDGLTDRGKTVYPLPLRGAGCIIIFKLCRFHTY
jgi:hypothetical protein